MRSAYELHYAVKMKDRRSEDTAVVLVQLEGNYWLVLNVGGDVLGICRKLQIYSPAVCLMH